jgi:hypothetical protein
MTPAAEGIRIKSEYITKFGVTKTATQKRSFRFNFFLPATRTFSGFGVVATLCIVHTRFAYQSME